MLLSFQVEMMSPEDPAVIEPCIAVLQKLSSQFYTGLTTDMQVPLLIYGHSMRNLLLSMIIYAGSHGSLL